MTKIYDCFNFYNEWDVLELRLQELYNHVDYFVLVEADRTHQNAPKEFLFDQNKDRYSQYLDKIIHIKVSDMPTGPNTWDRQAHQLRCITRGLTTAGPDDIVIVSDGDEINRASTVDYLRRSTQNLWTLRMPLFSLRFNWVRSDARRHTSLHWSTAARKSILDTIDPNILRNWRDDIPSRGGEGIDNAGWHFSFIGDSEFQRNKARTYAHSEVNREDFLNAIDVEASLREGRGWDRIGFGEQQEFTAVALDSFMPTAILDNPTKWGHLLVEATQTSGWDLYPQSRP
jgi:hypothetical protein